MTTLSANVRAKIANVAGKKQAKRSTEPRRCRVLATQVAVKARELERLQVELQAAAEATEAAKNKRLQRLEDENERIKREADRKHADQVAATLREFGCAPDPERVQGTKKRTAKAGTKRKPGRPRKDATAATAAPKRKPGRPRKDATAAAATTAPKRKPGRPRKDATAAAPKRKPGRPRKDALVSAAVQAKLDELEAPPKRKPGRPRKDAAAGAAKGKPGRPRKKAAATTGEEKRKPGRPRKDAAAPGPKPGPRRKRKDVSVEQPPKAPPEDRDDDDDDDDGDDDPAVFLSGLRSALAGLPPPPRAP